MIHFQLQCVANLVEYTRYAIKHAPNVAENVFILIVARFFQHSADRVILLLFCGCLFITTGVNHGGNILCITVIWTVIWTQSGP